ncbi:MAG: winged helix-turn-helix domain-containing protein [Cytophagales bacterium]|nr:winged helix-turn-helix domain-containing protein [Cytophagales bacterium]
MKNVTLNETYRIDFSRHQIKNLKDGTVRNLEPRLIQLLHMMIEREGQVVLRKDFIETVWGNYASGDELLTHSICLIRNALDKSMILTVPKRGYVLVAEVSRQHPYLGKVRSQFTYKRVAAFLLVLMVLKMILFPHH